MLEGFLTVFVGVLLANIIWSFFKKNSDDERTDEYDE